MTQTFVESDITETTMPPAGTAIFPLSFAQQRLWFIEQLLPGTSVYNLPDVWHLKGPLHLDAFRNGVSEIVRRHESLRTTFPATDGKPVQLIRPFKSFHMPMTDLRRDENIHETAARLIEEEVQRPFDLNRGPLFRARLLRLADDEHIAMFNAHHIISDGASLEIFRRELAALYTVFREGKSSPLPELPIQYADFAEWQREWLAGDVLKSQLSYWKECLRDTVEHCELPADRPRPPMPSFAGRTEFFSFERSLASALHDVSRRYQSTLFMTLLAAFQVLLHRTGGNEQLTIGSPARGRSQRETEALIGFFVNTLVLRTDLRGDPTFAELLSRVRDVALGAYSNQDVPFEMVVQEVRPERKLNRNPLFQVVFGFENMTGNAWVFPELDARVLDVDTATAKFDWTMLLQLTDQGLRGSLEYSTDLFEPATINRALENFRAVLESVVAEPNQPLSRLLIR